MKNRYIILLILLHLSNITISMEQKGIELLILPQETQFNIYTDPALKDRDIAKIIRTCKFLHTHVTKKNFLGHILLHNKPIDVLQLGDQFLRDTLKFYIAHDQFNDITLLCNNRVAYTDDFRIDLPFGCDTIAHLIFYK